MRIGHVALHVPDLEQAEAFYRGALDMEVLTREHLSDDGVWRQLPPQVGWAQARAADVEPHMVGLRRDGLVLALFPGAPTSGTVYLIGVAVDEEELAEVDGRLPEEATVEVATERTLMFVDPFGFRWQLTATPFRGAGEARGDWITLPR